jgi:hypothetical protein
MKQEYLWLIILGTQKICKQLTILNTLYVYYYIYSGDFFEHFHLLTPLTKLSACYRLDYVFYE